MASPRGQARAHSEGIKPCKAPPARHSGAHGPGPSGLGRNALEPEWEARVEPRSSGFRPGRGCQDAIAAIYNVCKGPWSMRTWALDADLAAASTASTMTTCWLLSDRPGQGHDLRLAESGRVRGGQRVRADGGRNSTRWRDSPFLLNVALHGLEEAAGVRYVTSGKLAGSTRAGSPVLIRYADDMVVLCHSQEQAGQVKARLAEWLAPRGLAFNEDKTRIVCLSEGFDFLGFNVRRYRSKAADQAVQGGHQAAPGTARGRNAHPARRQHDGGHRHTQPHHPGLGGLLPALVSSRQFHSLDNYLWKLTYKWATWRHANKPKRWIVNRYFGRFNKFRNDRWVFGDRDSGACRVKFSWTHIERHAMVKGSASPDDPALASYWARRRRARLPLDRYILRLLTRQAGLCPLCGDHLLTADQPPQSPEQWEHWWLQVTRTAIAASYLALHGRPGLPDDDQTRLVHASCQRRKPALHLRHPRGLLEPCAGTTRTHGSEGAGARQRAPATRQEIPRVVPGYCS